MQLFSLASALVMFAAIGHWPYGFYQLVRLLGTINALALATRLSKDKYEGLILTLLVTAVVFNPIFPFYLGRDLWRVADGFAGILFVAGALSIEEPGRSPA